MRWTRGLSLAGCAVALAVSCIAVLAQGVPTPPGAVPNASAPPPSPTCARLEGELASIDRGPSDPARAGKIQQYEDAINKQQSELDRTTARLRRIGCEGSGFFSLFRSQPNECGPLTRQVQQMHDNLDRMMNELQRLQGNTADRENERRSVLLALGQNSCGPQYRTASTGPQRRGLLDSLFGPGSIIAPEQAPAPAPSGPPQSSTYETICVRSCDGYYWPISFSTVPSRFPEDERACQRMCPAAPVSLYTYRNPGEDVHRAVSLTGQPYTALPNAFEYRKHISSACSCRRPGESWAQALGTSDDTIERGDIVVTEKRAEQMSKPQEPRSAKNKGRTAGKAATQGTTKPAATATPSTPISPANSESKPDHIRQVGPVFLPNR